MSVQDFRYRAISWYAFPLLALFLLLENLQLSLTEVGLNLGFILLNYALTTAMISLKYGRIVNLMNQHIGVGDLLMLFCLALYFPALNFFLFYLGSLLLIAIGSGLYIIFNRPKAYTVPLAGLQSILLLFLMLSAWTFELQLNKADWIEHQYWFQNYLL